MIAKLLVLHFIADFLLQTREMGKTKSSNPVMLAGHMLIQWLVFLPFTNGEFATVNMLIHGLIDWNIWRLDKYSVVQRFSQLHWKDPQQAASYDYWNDSWFYNTIGFDQMAHGLTLVFLAGALL